MKITDSQLNNKISFGKIIIPKEEVRVKILKGLNEKQLTTLKKDLIEQESNPVNAVIYNSFIGLKAKIYSKFRLENFKEDYKQKPLLESKAEFLKRIINKCNEYKKQLDL